MAPVQQGELDPVIHAAARLKITATLATITPASGLVTSTAEPATLRTIQADAQSALDAAAVAVAAAVPLAYLTLAGRKQAMARIGQTRSGLIEDALVVAAGAAIVALSTRPRLE